MRIRNHTSALASALVLATSVTSAQDITREPATVRLEVGDLRRLASDLRSGGSDTLAALERYLAEPSPGLRVYTQRYSVDAPGMRTAIRDNRAAYANLGALADSILAQEAALRTAFRKLQELFPDAAFPPIWFVAADHGPGGMVQREGVVIATERFVGRAEDVVPIVLHELAHFQSAMVQGVETYQRIYGPSQTLLALAIREGTAELIAELTTGRHINPAAERYGATREAELWAAFRRDMDNRDPGEWMFVQPADRARPPDLGYWIGYRIAKSYYERASDKAQAIRDIIAVIDFTAFLASSGYAERF